MKPTGEVAREDVRFSTIEEALEDIAAGKMIVVVDDEDRENEGDVVMAAEFVTADDINFMTRQAGGWICLTLTPDRCDELGLELMSLKNESAHETPFTVTIEAREGVTTGISTADQATTIRTAVAPDKGKADIVVPGHVHPLKAREGGVLERTGHTEASVDLARLAGVTPAGVICEVQNEDGSMARVGDLAAYCHKHGFKMITIADLIAYRRRHDKLVERVVVDVDADRLRRLHRVRVPVAGRRQAPRRDGQGRRRGQGGRPGPGALRVPDRRRVPLAALRLRRAAGERAVDDRGRGRGRPAVPRPGGARHRPAEQAQGLQVAGGGLRHRRRQPQAGAARRTCATTASARRSWPTSGCRRCGS